MSTQTTLGTLTKILFKEVDIKHIKTQLKCKTGISELAQDIQTWLYALTECDV